MRFVSWNEFKKTAVPATATITQIETYRTGTRKHRKTHHVVHIEYTANGVRYSNTLGEYSSLLKRGDIVNISYDPNDPNRIMTKPDFMCVVLGGISVIFTCISLLLLFSEFKNSLRAKRLEEDNIYVMCEKWDYIPSNMVVNRVRYISVRCRYADSMGFNAEFISAPFNPNKRPFAIGRPIKVYVDSETDPGMYYVPIDAQEQ